MNLPKRNAEEEFAVVDRASGERHPAAFYGVREASSTQETHLTPHSPRLAGNTAELQLTSAPGISFSRLILCFRS
uniref:Uncharacterized protein n=1 Tax=Plectus sambesii TaxID=2011161 RepID=A0A914VAB0_9BILA